MYPSGFTLLEFLISLLLVSIGLVSLQSLQINSLKSYKNDLAFASAQQLSHDLIERIKANPQALDTYQDHIHHPPAGPVDCHSRHCTAEQLAQYDMWHWHQSKNQQLHFFPSTQICLQIEAQWLHLQWDWSTEENYDAQCSRAAFKKDIFLLR